MKNCAPFNSNQAVAVIHAPRGPLDGDQAVYVAATRRATELFGVDGQLVGRTLTQFIADRERDMPDYQYRAFMWEQTRLAVAASSNAPTVIATTPIVFSTGRHKARRTCLLSWPTMKLVRSKSLPCFIWTLLLTWNIECIMFWMA